MRPRRFYCTRIKTYPDELTATLIQAGYILADSVQSADFLFMYDDSPHNIKTLRGRPMFIAPHTPYSFFCWDILPDNPPDVMCNFVVSHTAKESMRLFGYPNRVEKIGFFGGPVQDFKPTTGTKLLFAPQHAIHDRKLPTPEHLTWTREASHWIIKNLKSFESVTVRYSNTLEICGLEEFEGKPVIFEPVDVYKIPFIRKHALTAIEKADLVISIGTFAYLSVASGKPTLFYGYKTGMPCSREGYAKNYELYRHLFHFPYIFEDMSAEQVLEFRNAPDPKVEEWKCNNIGEPFSPHRFLQIIKEHF